MRWRREGGVPAGGATPGGQRGGGLPDLSWFLLIVWAVTKFSEGAWIILALIPILVVHFKAVHRHYEGRGGEQFFSLKGWLPTGTRRNRVIVPISGVHRAVVEALEYARSLSPDVRAIFVDTDPRATEQVRTELGARGARACRWSSSIHRTAPSSSRSSATSTTSKPGNLTPTSRLSCPEFVPARWWQHLLHNQRALILKGTLLFRPNTVVTNVPFHLRK